MRSHAGVAAASTAVRCCSTRSWDSAAGTRKSVCTPSSARAHLLAGAVARGCAHLRALERGRRRGVAHHQRAARVRGRRAGGPRGRPARRSHPSPPASRLPGYARRCAELVVAQDLRVLGRPGPAGSGIGRYVECLNEALTEPRPELGLRIEEITEPQRWEPLEHVLQARAVKRLGADVLHTPSLDFLSLRPGAPLVVTLHDLAPLEEPRGLPAHRAAAQAALPGRAARSAGDGAFARGGRRRRADARHRPRAHRRGALRGAAGLRAGGGRPRARLSRLGLPAHYLLWVGSLDPIDPRKGVEPLVEAVAAGDGPAAGAGRRGVAGRRRAAGPARAGAGAGPGDRLRAAGALHRRRGAGLPLRGRGLRLPAAGGAGLRHAGGRLRRRVAARGAGGGRGSRAGGARRRRRAAGRPRPAWPERRRERPGAGLGPGGRRGGGRVPRGRRPRGRRRRRRWRRPPAPPRRPGRSCSG